MNRNGKSAFLACALCAALLLAGCAQTVTPPASPSMSTPPTEASPTPVPGGSLSAGGEFAGVSYEFSQSLVYYPEGSDEATADYLLDMTLPVFLGEGEAAAHMNEAVSMCRSELLERVVSERLPLADRIENEAPPYTRLTSEAIEARGYLNLRFSEETGFGEDVERELYVLVLDGDGNEIGLAAAVRLFDPSDLAAQQVLNQVAKDEAAYYGDITADNVKRALDLFNGFEITESGYTLYVPEGALAKPEKGMLRFDVEKSAFYPDFVGATIPIERYDALEDAISLLARSVGLDSNGFADGSPDALTASRFLSCLLRATPEVSKADYEAAFAAYFTGALPQDIDANGDGTRLEGDACSLASPPSAGYSVELIEASPEDGGISLKGDFIHGIPGSSDASVAAFVEVFIQPDEAAPLGYRFVSFFVY